jgi:hypothetical protein
VIDHRIGADDALGADGPLLTAKRGLIATAERRIVAGVKRLSPPPPPCHSGAMKRPDRYDLIGLAILSCVIALFVAHFVLPPAPPLDEPDALAGPPGIGGIGGPGIGAPGIGGAR